MLDAVLKPRYVSIYRQCGSHRKAGFLFLEWLSQPNGSLHLHQAIKEYDQRVKKKDPNHDLNAGFSDLVLSKMLTKDVSKRWTLAQCLDHKFISGIKLPAEANLHKSADATETPESKAAADEHATLAAKARAIRARRQADTADMAESPPLIAGVLHKLNTDGQLGNEGDWLQRQMWLGGNGSLCYFSQKKEKRLVLIDNDALCRGSVRCLNQKTEGSAKQFAFELKFQSQANSDQQDNNADAAKAIGDRDAESQYYAADTAEDRDRWVSFLQGVIDMRYGSKVDTKVLISQGLIDDYSEFKIQIRNRREKISEDTNAKDSGFHAVFDRKFQLWKLNQTGDANNEGDWLMREMWIAKNGALCYHSKKEDRDLQYYKAEDMKCVTIERLGSAQSCKANSFSLTLPPVDGLEYAAGVFAAESQGELDTLLMLIGKFQKSRSRK